MNKKSAGVISKASFQRCLITYVFRTQPAALPLCVCAFVVHTCIVYLHTHAGHSVRLCRIDGTRSEESPVQTASTSMHTCQNWDLSSVFKGVGWGVGWLQAEQIGEGTVLRTALVLKTPHMYLRKNAHAFAIPVHTLLTAVLGNHIFLILRLGTFASSLHLLNLICLMLIMFN